MWRSAVYVSSLNIMYRYVKITPNFLLVYDINNITVGSITGLPLHGPLSKGDKPETLFLFLHKKD